MPDTVTIQTTTDVVTIAGGNETQSVAITGNTTVEVLTVGVQGPQGASYTLPIATNGTLGGVIVGGNLTINGNGVLSALSAPYTLPMATNGTLGGVIVGGNLTINGNGVLSAQSSAWGNISGAPNITTGNDGTINIYGAVQQPGGIQANATLSTFFQVTTGSNLVFAGENANMVYGGNANMTSFQSNQYSLVFRSQASNRRLSLGHLGSPNPSTTQGVYMTNVDNTGTISQLDRVQAGFFYSKYCMMLEHFEANSTGVGTAQMLINSGHVELRYTQPLTPYSLLTLAQCDARYVKIIGPRGNGTA